MSVQSQRDCDVLLTANHQLEQMYHDQHDPCLALHISRNYHLLEEQDSDVMHQQLWKNKAQIWWQLYWANRSNKGLGLFYDENGCYY